MVVTSKIEISVSLKGAKWKAGLVAQGFGIAVMPDIPILRSLSVKTLDIYNPPYERAVYLATLKQRYLSPVAKAFIRFVIEETS